MTMQNVNLFLPELRPKHEWLTLNSLLASAIGFAIMLGYTAFQFKQNIQQHQWQIARIEEQKSATQVRIQKILSRPRLGNSKNLEQRLHALKRNILAREKIGQIIIGQNLGNETGFSSSLHALAKHSTETVTLEHFRISRGGSFIEVKGETLKPKDIPLFLQRLQQEQSFVATEFGPLAVQRSRINNDRHSFAMGFDDSYPLLQKEAL